MITGSTKLINMSLVFMMDIGMLELIFEYSYRNQDYNIKFMRLINLNWR